MPPISFDFLFGVFCAFFRIFWRIFYLSFDFLGFFISRPFPGHLAFQVSFHISGPHGPLRRISGFHGWMEAGFISGIWFFTWISNQEHLIIIPGRKWFSWYLLFLVSHYFSLSGWLTLYMYKIINAGILSRSFFTFFIFF